MGRGKQEKTHTDHKIYSFKRQRMSTNFHYSLTQAHIPLKQRQNSYSHLTKPALV